MDGAAVRSRAARRRSRWIVSAISLVAMLAGLVLSIALLRRTRDATDSAVQFDRRECVRFADVSRVYVIRHNPFDSAELWLGTAEGVRVLDSRAGTWTRLGLDHGLPSETVADVSFSGDTVWVATWNGVAWFDRSARVFFSLGGTGTGRVLSITSFQRSSIFFYVDGRGIHRVRTGDTLASPVSISGLSSGTRVTFLACMDSLLLVGAEGGRLLTYDPVRERVQECLFVRPRSARTLVWDVLRYGGRMYVAMSDDGVWTGRDFGDTLRPLPGFPAKGAYTFAIENDGFWCGTPFGLWRYHERNATWVQFVHPDQTEPTDFQVFSLARRGSVLWYGSMDLGAGYLNTEHVEWVDLRAGLSSPNVVGLASDGASLWVGFGHHAAYLDRLDAVDMQFERNYNSRDSILESHVQSLAIINGRLYYGGYRGFGYLTLGETWRRCFFLSGDHERLPFADIAGIAAWDSSSIALAGLFAVVRYWPERDSFAVLESTATGRITCVFPRGDTLWYGTLVGGLYVYDRKTGRARDVGLRGMGRIVGVEGLPGLQEALIVATQDNGCHVVNTVTLQIRALDIPQQLFPRDCGPYERQLVAMRVMDGRVWLGTRDAGCVVYDPDTQRWVGMNYRDGLVSNEVRAFCESPGYVWIGCYGGTSRFSKEYLETRYFRRSTPQTADLRARKKG